VTLLLLEGTAGTVRRPLGSSRRRPCLGQDFWAIGAAPQGQITSALRVGPRVATLRICRSSLRSFLSVAELVGQGLAGVVEFGLQGPVGGLKSEDGGDAGKVEAVFEELPDLAEPV
jgi:hypothetical protein